MPWKHILITATRGLGTHLTRSALTILGIVIGVAAIIIVMSLGQGAQDLILDQVSGLGPETVVLRPGSGNSDFTSVLFSQSITQKDLETLQRKQNVPNLVSVAPFVIMTDPVEYRGEKYRPTLMGGPAEFIAGLLDVQLANGQFYTDNDIQQNARVAMIGAEIKNDLFGNSRAIGEQIQIRDRKFRVIGVFEDSSNTAGFDVNKMIIIPHTSAQTYVTGTDFYNEVMLRADVPENAEKMAYDIELTLRDEHDIGFGEEDDFHVQTQEDVIEQIETIVNVFTAFLIAVVSISLVVGGIGIMNIMLVSVSERTKEIGLRKALGARGKDILRQFLTEAVILTSIGGVVGTIIGTLISLGVSLILAQTVAEDWTFSFPVAGAFLGVGVSAGVGLLFGIYPAGQASKKSPIEALRYE